MGVPPKPVPQRPKDEGTSETLRLLEVIAGTLREVLWLRDLAEERILYVSPAFAEVWGQSVESLLASPRVWIDSVHPDDRERVLSAALNEARGGEDHMEYRIVRPDGGIRWVRDRSYPIRNERGVITRMAGLAEDITATRMSKPK